jgi:hypothetical protein
MDVADLLFAGLCSARCLLAMETPPGWVGCRCTCDGRYHAALIDHQVEPIAEVRDAHGNDAGIRPEFRKAS